MSHFRGTLNGGQGATATKSGTKASGLTAVAASWSGAIKVELRHNEATGKDQYSIREWDWHGKGIHRVLIDWTDFASETINFNCNHK